MNAKLRDALNKIGNISTFVAENCGNVETAKYMNDIISIVQEAIAEPLRNCDVFASESEMKAAFIDYYNELWSLKGTFYEIDYCDLKHDVDGILYDYIKWVLAPVKPEMEGKKE